MVKPGGVAGLMRGTALREAFGLATASAGTTAGSSVGGEADVHAAAMERVGLGCNPANPVLVVDLAAHLLQTVDGSFGVPDVPGLGVDHVPMRVLAAT